MSTATSARTHGSAYFAADSVTFTKKGHRVERQPDGTAIVRGVEIFKAGTFRDMFGEQSTWTPQHLQMMVTNFELLRDSDIFPDVPVRRDHSMSIEKVMGYFESMYATGDKLLGDFHITESSQVQRFEKGTYRSVSLEVGMFVSNDETPYWPVVQGVAYVDIPAVEGLHSKSNSPIAFFSRNPDKEQEQQDMSADDDKGVQRPTMSAFRVNGGETRDHASVQAHILDLEGKVAAHKPAAFRIKGAETLDVVAVQAHIETLEGFAKEAKEGARQNFVKELAKDGKIAETMVEFFTKQAVGMDDALYTEFTAGWEAAPKMSLLANHGKGSNADGNSAPGQTDGAASEKLILEEQLKMHRDAGMTEARIAETKAFKRLAIINGNS